MLNSFLFDLQLFADGGANGSAGDGAGSNGGNGLSGDFNVDMQRYFGVPARNTGGQAPADGDNADHNGETDGTDAGSVTAEDNVDASASVEQTEKNPDDEFEELIKGRFKEQFGKRTQSIINERFKDSKAKDAKISAYEDLIAPLRDKYGLADDAEIGDIADAIKNDNTMFSRQAMAQGMSTDAYRDNYYSQIQQRKDDAAKDAERQHAAAQQQEADKVRYMQETAERWNSEAEELKKSYPQFDLSTELKENAAFRQAVEAGLPIAQAYYGANFEKITSGIVAAASQQATKRAAETIARNRTRPDEGGTAAGTGIKTGIDVNNLTGPQIRDILKRVQNGEQISF